MRFPKVIILLFSVLVSSNVEAQIPSKNLFVEIDVSKSGDEMIRYGRIIYDDNYKTKRSFFEGEEVRQMFLDSLSQDLALLPPAKRNTLFYIHGMWAYQWSFLKGNHKKMQSDMWANNINPNGMVVTIIWHCKVKYDENKMMALNSGKILSPLVRQIHDITSETSPNSTTNYMIHSMGHRVFQNIWNDHFSKDMNYSAGHILMAGADLETNTFEKGEALEGIGYLSNNILVYRHNNDRTLGVSKMLNNEDRLGFDGIRDINKISKSITQVDVSVITDNEDPPSKFSNHRYFYMSPTVRKDIALFFMDANKESIPRRKELGHERNLMLEMPIEDLEVK